jgi:UDPglucose 6-dehydrogenase
MVGLGKLGLPVALAIDNKGHRVIGTDVNQQVVDYLGKGEIPYREKDLQPLLDDHTVGWRDTIKDVVAESDLIFVAVQTPHAPEFEGVTPLTEDRADFDYSYLVRSVAEIAKICAEQQTRKTVAVISTCLPGTFEREIAPLLNDYVAYVYCPLFIAMGTVLEDYLNPEFNLIGVRDLDAACLMVDFYSTINTAPPLKTDITTAEGVKVSYNTWITAKTVIANAWGELSERLGMNFNDILKAWSLADKG